MLNGTPTQNFPAKTVPSKNNNSNLYNFRTINFSNKVRLKQSLRRLNYVIKSRDMISFSVFPGNHI